MKMTDINTWWDCTALVCITKPGLSIVYALPGMYWSSIEEDIRPSPQWAEGLCIMDACMFLIMNPNNES